MSHFVGKCQHQCRMPTREPSIIKTPPFFTISVHTYRIISSAASSRWAQGSSLNILFLTMQTEYYYLWQLIRLFSTAVSVTSGVISSIKHSNSYPDLYDRWDVHDAMEWWWVEPHKISITTVSFCCFSTLPVFLNKIQIHSFHQPNPFSPSSPRTFLRTNCTATR